jgi:hypothetical protein
MKTNELRIGNLVNYNNLANSVRGIDETYIELFDNTYAYIDNIEPIPLTGDWLEKFGFKSIDKQSNLFYSSKLIRITLPTSRCTSGVCYVSVRGCKVFNNENYFRAGINLKIKYVHQLQNLYFVLTGKELKIK